MIEQIHVHQKVEKDMEQMNALDNTPAIASGRARAIIDALLSGAPIARAGLLAKAKDARLKNLFKYNLGKGYRLVTIKEKNQLFVLFIGDHDACDRWLDANSKKTPHRRPLPMSIYPVHCTERCNRKEACDSRDFDPDFDGEDEIFASPVSQKELRRVFCGLIH